MNKPSINLEILEEKLGQEQGQGDWEKAPRGINGINVDQILETDIYLGVLGGD